MGESLHHPWKAVEEPFLMPVSDVVPLRQGRAVMFTGAIERGHVHTGDTVEFVGLGNSGCALVTEIDARGTRVDEAGVGRNVGLVLRGVEAGGGKQGQVLAAPGSVGAHAHFTAEIELLPEDEGGRDVVTGSRLIFYAYTAALRGTVTLPQGLDTLRPHGSATVTVALDKPLALEEGRPFAFRHYGRAAGSGIVTRLLAQ
ncbi:hypothetical protein, partial [Streptomyces sp. NRRL S-1813]|uniref:EF-Tu C-terminal domain-related protein n=1 Tax=Streptomyces sp. NRRL S-1813 TaxID=1463888 RepID=UPI0004CBD187